MRWNKLIDDGVGVMGLRIVIWNIASLLGDSLAHSDGNSLVLHMANLLGDLGTLGDGFTLAHLIRNKIAFMSVDIVTLFLRNTVTNLVGNLLRVSLLHIMTFIIGVLLAGARNNGPNLLGSNNFPMVFTIIFILGDTLGLSVWLQHCLVLISADLLVLGVADLVLDKMTFFSGRVLTQPLALHLTDLLVDCVTCLEWLLLVLRVPHHHILHSTLDGTGVMERLHKLLRL